MVKPLRSLLRSFPSSTLTSLTLHHPFGRCPTILKFALHFPNLRYLCIDWLNDRRCATWVQPDSIALAAAADHSTLVRRHLWLVQFSIGFGWPEGFSNKLRGRFDPQSLELDGALVDQAEYLQNVFGNTVEYLMIISSELGTCGLLTLTRRTTQCLTNSPSIEYPQPHFFEFMGLTALCRLTFRPAFYADCNYLLEFSQILTVRSLALCELVLGLGRLRYYYSTDRDRRGVTNEFLEGQYDKHGDFKFIVRTGNALPVWCDKRSPSVSKKGMYSFQSIPLD